jgi:protein O-mannosyl-transferase
MPERAVVPPDYSPITCQQSDRATVNPHFSKPPENLSPGDARPPARPVDFSSSRDFFSGIRSLWARTKSLAGPKINFAIYALLIWVLLLIVYRPVLPGNFLMDDHRLVHDDNPLLNGQLTPANLWFSTDFTLSTFGFWLQWCAWGENPLGYHLVNLILHAASCILLWRLLKQLKIPGAWLAGIIFALHPVAVNSVARIAEFKNTLSLPFFLLSFLAYLHYENTVLFPANQNFLKSPPKISGWHLLSFVAFLFALLSKTSTVMLPVMLLACAIWQRGRLVRRDWIHTTPHFVLALAFGVLSIWFQKHQALAAAGETLAPESFAAKLTIAGQVFWFYLGKAFLPFHLNVVYPQWKAADISSAIYTVPILLGWIFIVCRYFGWSWGRHLFFALSCFAIALFPVLGFFDSQFLVKWQVSDHLQYLPLIVPTAFMAAVFASLAKTQAFRLVTTAVLLLFATLTFDRAKAFATEESLMRDTLAKNPAATDAYNDLGIIAAKKSDLSAAAGYFSQALRSDPDNAAAHSNMAQALAMLGRLSDAETECLAALKLEGPDATVLKRLASIQQQEGRFPEAIVNLRIAILFDSKWQPDLPARMQLATLFHQAGDARQAIGLFQQIISLQPRHAEALNNLAWLLATAADENLRDGAQAVRYAEQACLLTKYKEPFNISTLAAAYAEAGRFSEAVNTAETALQMQIQSGQMRFAAINQQLLALYRAGQPFHEAPLVAPAL